MSDLIEIRGLRLMGKHGLLDFEKEIAQLFEFDVSLHVDTYVSSQSDELDDTVSYVEVIDLIKDVVDSNQFSLIERLAEQVADQVLGLDLVNAVDVTVRKPHAPVDAIVEYVGVTIHRSLQ